MRALQYAGWLIGVPLELLIIAALLREGWRRFPFLFLYTVALFLTTVVEVPAYLAYFSGTRLAHSRAFYYWIDEGIRQTLLFTVVISLIYLATTGIRSRRLVRGSLILAAAVFAAISFLIHYDPHASVGTWMTLWTRDLSFSSAILDLTLWTMLLATHNSDLRLFMLSGALGLQFTGEAIGETLRNQFPALLLGANALILVANLACMYLWWQTLRVPAPGKAPVRAAPQ